jgi:hypothetical protein
VAVEAVGVAADVVAVEAACVGVPELPAASSSDIWKVTGNGQPPALGLEDELAVPPLEVEARLTDPTPYTRRRATIVPATEDCDAAHPLS